jgi:hypothetical protein
MTPTVKRRIGAAVGLVIAYIGAAFGIWPFYHFWAILLVVAGTSAAIYAEFSTFSWLAITLVLSGAGVLFYWIAGPLPPEEPGTHGFLVPANLATPRTACTPGDSSKGPEVTGQGWFFVTVAGGGVLTVTPTNKLIAVSVDGRPTVVIERSEKGILLDVDMFNPDGTLAVRIEKNAWTRSTAQTFKATKPDASTLSVVGIRGEELLWVQYMNANTVKIRGTFYRIGDPQPAVITDSSIDPGHMQLHMAPTMQAVTFVPCFVVGTPDFRDPILLFR